jgi:hypothetical protein
MVSKKREGTESKRNAVQLFKAGRIKQCIKIPDGG